MTPQEHIKQFEEWESLRHANSFLDYGDDDCPPEINWDNIKSHFISTVISVLKEQEEVVDGIKAHYPIEATTTSNFERAINWANPVVHQALSDYKLSLKKQIEEWEALNK